MKPRASDTSHGRRRAAIRWQIVVAHGLLLLPPLVGFAAATADTGQPGELRGLWVDSWNHGILNRIQCEQLVKTARDQGFNALFVEVRKTGDAAYRSLFVPRATNVAADFDPLATICRLAHDTSGGRRALQVHAWGVVYRVWKKSLGRPPDPRHVVLRHKDWLNVNSRGKTETQEGTYLDPGHPEVQNHLVRVFMEIAERYDIDGLHLDYVRYPEREWGYSSESQRLFRSLYSGQAKPAVDDEAWMRWRRFQVTSLVRRLAGELGTRKPSVLLSAALIPWGDLQKGYELSGPMCRAYQDWVLWKREGLLDWLCLMNYKRQNNRAQARDFRDWSTLAAESPGQAHDAIGMGNYLNRAADSLKQMRVIREVKNDGALIYSYSRSVKKGERSIDFLRQLKREFFQTPIDPPVCPWKTERGTLLVHLLNEDGQPRQLHPVILKRRRSSKSQLDSLTDINGWTTFTRLEPGRYDLIVPKTREGTSGRPVRQIQIEAGEGKRVLTTSVSKRSR